MKQTTGASVTNCFHGNKLFRYGKEEDGLIYQKIGQEEQHFLLQSTHTKFGKQLPATSYQLPAQICVPLVLEVNKGGKT
jgi:hypothetical protein